MLHSCAKASGPSSPPSSLNRQDDDDDVDPLLVPSEVASEECVGTDDVGMRVSCRCGSTDVVGADVGTDLVGTGLGATYDDGLWWW
mmetsp:Transcript_922/g.1680  ORF Transcript_922/g.1680 Transcript_922/m.1680 type:complete len:86 (-) Transcript_922:1143-1400(-)